MYLHQSTEQSDTHSSDAEQKKARDNDATIDCIDKFGVLLEHEWARGHSMHYKGPDQQGGGHVAGNAKEWNLKKSSL